MTRQIIVSLTAMILTTPLASAQIDMHCHMIPDSYLEAIKAHGMVMDEGFPIPAWDAEEHLKFMDEAGIQTSVLRSLISAMALNLQLSVGSSTKRLRR